MKITPREKRRHAAGREKILSPRRLSPFLAWGDFHARSRFARSTIPEEKWGLLVVYFVIRTKYINWSRNLRKLLVGSNVPKSIVSFVVVVSFVDLLIV